MGIVSFVNTLPLVDGLERAANVSLQHSVPSGLIDRVLDGSVDVALCSSIDFQRAPRPLMLVPVGLLGCDGPTMTVRLFSTRPIERIREVHCDTDSHTSVALMRIVLKRVFDLEVTCVPYNAREHVAGHRPMQWPDAMLLIGDKVVTDSTPAVRYPYQLDLGAAWVELTGLPFVFACWMADRAADPEVVRTAAMILDRQRRKNQREQLPQLAGVRAVQRGWPADLAAEYLTQRITYDVTPRRLEGLERFFIEAHRLELIDQVRPIECFEL